MLGSASLAIRHIWEGTINSLMVPRRMRTAYRRDNDAERNLGTESTGKGDHRDKRTGGRVERNTCAGQIPGTPGHLRAGAPGAAPGAPGGLTEGCSAGLGTVPERPRRHPRWEGPAGRVPSRAGEPPCVPRAAGPGSRGGPAGGARGAGSDARGTRGQRRGRGGRLRPGRSGVPVLTFCGAPGACPSCRPPRTAWAAACGPAGPALPGEENSREPA